MARKAYIDVMRAIGILLIILAHVYPCQTDFWFNFRSFDVPLMLFVSGLSYAGRNMTYSRAWLVKRFKRLCFPLWIFLTILFLFRFAMHLIFGAKAPTWQIMRDSYTMYWGIGYVWIFRVFLLVGIAVPALLAINRQLARLWAFLLVLGAALLLLEWVHPQLCVWSITRETVLYLWGYAIVFLLGLRMGDAHTTQGERFVALLCVAGGLIVAWLCTHREPWFELQSFKYPPRALFLLYGMTASVILYLLLARLQRAPRWLLFIGGNTGWIYLWHIFVVQSVSFVAGTMPWTVKLLVVALFAILMTYVQVRLVNVVKAKRELPILKYLVG
ncbi:MAG: acyltransferase [Bacteroidaceae bacterium]|nr:acyltransferase [Bacteroidaceae bacterium]